MLRLIQFLIEGCWHKFEAKERISMYASSNSQMSCGSKYVYQCTKCFKIKTVKDY